MSESSMKCFVQQRQAACRYRASDDKQLQTPLGNVEPYFVYKPPQKRLVKGHGFSRALEFLEAIS